MAHTKAQRAVRGNRDGNPKYRGVKLFGGQKAIAGNIIIRQQGSVFNAGDGVLMGRDFTLMALKPGIVTFYIKQGKKFVKIIEDTNVLEA